MKIKKLKARRMWANPADFGEQSMHLTAHRDPSSDRGNVVPVAVIPLDDVGALIDRVFVARINADRITFENTREMLAAIGVLRRVKTVMPR